VEGKMDLILDILIPKKDINKLNIEEILVEWGGETFSQDPKKYKFQSSVFFQEYDNWNYYKKIVGNNLEQYDFIAFTLQGESLTDLEFMVNNHEQNQKANNELIELFYELYKALDTFCIILLLDEEQIDEKYELADVDQAINIFLESLNWGSPKGIVISKGL